MKALLIYPLFPKTFWSFEKYVNLFGHKALLPPLGLVTVAAILPQEWEFRLVDRNVSTITEEMWSWAEIVIISAMIVQKEDFKLQIQEAKRRGKKVAVGGPYPTSLPEEAKIYGADYLILDEGEITLPLFVEALKKGETSGVFRSEGHKPDVTTTPIPRFDLLDLDAYVQMSVQFSRGCPFQCEFCDIITLYGRKPRTKTPQQLLAELDYLYELGWRRGVFMVDDNFIGNKRNVKLLLQELKVWQEERHYPFGFLTEASVNLAEDEELMNLMVDCNFVSVFLGIETPDEDSLELTKKFQNTRHPLDDAIDKITRAGLVPMAGFIVGFDGEKKGAGQRIAEFVERVAIPRAFFTMLQALPNTALWTRLENEQRLLKDNVDINQTSLINFTPTRPIEEIVDEYIQGFWNLYEPEAFLERTHRCFLKFATSRGKTTFTKRRATQLTWKEIKVLLILFWRQGLKSKTRWLFWSYLFSIIKNNPQALFGYVYHCASLEHFVEYRQIVRNQVETSLKQFLSRKEQVLIATR
ncbi:B12-binding domain-containing radical SAM protein [Gloeothece verrucosa]|uniref:Radical SAM domain protein n=1 Tax=Gloeothece verrucosa (strain PCC 7822) TaxID=497965 RepID=E0U786_GLOV7|nr:B12-binding domain-containing radical SAM protein [Gloeothece verrucosa]ADN12473.1 Radical SAM domain protein [Gloeothece verrucosa PCC 7822]